MSKDLVRQLVENGGNCVNLGRSMLIKYPALHRWILDNTTFLDHKPKLKFNERIYCILNDITSEQFNDFGDPAYFGGIFVGYSYASTLYNKIVTGREKRRIKELIRNEREAARELKPQKTKIDEFLIRNKIRNADLYYDTAIKGYDYVECPITGARMHILGEKHIVMNLEMTISEFDNIYPGARKCSTRRLENVKNGLRQIDQDSGVSKHRLGIIKSCKTLSTIDPLSGLSGYQKLGQKTRATHMSNVDDEGLTGYQRQARYRTTTVLENGLTIEQNAHIKQRKSILLNNSTGSGGASKISKVVLKPILDYLVENKIKYYFDNNEYGILDTDTNRYYFYDLYIPLINMVIEYQSNAFHADPSLPKEVWDNWHPVLGKKKTAMESLLYDYQKAKALYKHRGILTFHVWENSRDEEVEELLCLVKTMNTKY